MAGIFALLGVLLGALTSVLTTWLLARRAERREAKIAGRIVREDVVTGGPLLETTLRHGWYEEFELPLEGWAKHRTALAGELSRDAWDDVAGAFASLRHVQIMLASVSVEGGGEIKVDDIPPNGVEVISDTIQDLKRASAALGPFT